MTSGAALSRRTVLGLAALGIAGCKRGSSASVPRVAPDAAVLADAHGPEAALIGAYTLAIASAKGSELARLTAERDLHRAHLARLGARSGIAGFTGDSIHERLRLSVAHLRSLAVSAVDGPDAAVLASIAASHEVMLRD